MRLYGMGRLGVLSPKYDHILLPNVGDFESYEHYLATAFHKLVHWTGTEQRLKRDLKPWFDTKAYAAEEFVAESGAAFLCAHLEVIHVPPGILEVAGGDAGQITDRQQRIQASLYLHHLNLPQLHDDLLGRQFLSAFSLSSPGYVLSFRLVQKRPGRSRAVAPLPWR